MMVQSDNSQQREREAHAPCAGCAFNGALPAAALWRGLQRKQQSLQALCPQPVDLSRRSPSPRSVSSMDLVIDEDWQDGSASPRRESSVDARQGRPLFYLPSPSPEACSDASVYARKVEDGEVDGASSTATTLSCYSTQSTNLFDDDDDDAWRGVPKSALSPPKQSWQAIARRRHQLSSGVIRYAGNTQRSPAANDHTAEQQQGHVATSGWECGKWQVLTPQTPWVRCPTSPTSPTSPSRPLPAPPPCPPGDGLLSGHPRYSVGEYLGRGVYGKVLKCFDKFTGKTRAVKILSLSGNWKDPAKNEARALAHVAKNYPDRHHLLRLFESFEWRGNLCLVTEMLQMDLATFLRRRGKQPVHPDDLASVVHQLSCALAKLNELDIIHSDVKPANIMLASASARPFSVKLIDLSNALTGGRASLGPYAQSRWYRAPEVALGQAWDARADVWSLGCVAAELATGQPLYPCAGDLQLLWAVQSTHGGLPQRVLGRPGGGRGRILTRDACGMWHLQKCENFRGEDYLEDLNEVPKKYMALLPKEEADNFVIDIALFADLLRQMLDVDAETRISAKDILMHPFADVQK